MMKQPDGGYFKDTIKGISWVGALRVTTRVIAFARIAILARLLTPAQFGVFGIAALVLALVETLTETGINVFLIQEKRAIERYLHTAWIVSIARGTLIALAILVSAPFISLFFKSPDSLSILLLISLVPFLRGFINPAIVRFQKELQFGREFWFRFSVFIVDSSIAASLAFVTREASSLVWGLVAGAVFEVLLSFLVIKPIPRFIFEFERLKLVFSRGKWITLAGIFNYVFQHGDDVVVGKLLGTSPLGLYQMAYRIATLPITEVAIVVSRVTFPVLIRISQDRERLRRAFIRTMAAVTLLVFPLGIVILAFPRQVIELILGSNWVGATTVLQVLVIFGMIRAVSDSMQVLFLAEKRQEFVTVVSFVSTVGLAVSIIPLVALFGMVGAGIATIIGTTVALPFVFYYSWVILKRR